MNNSTVNISFKKDLLSQIDQTAREESRSRSELIREAARHYIKKKETWKQIFAYGDKQAGKTGLAESDVLDEIHTHREQK